MQDNPFYAFIDVVEADQKIDQIVAQNKKYEQEIAQLMTQVAAEKAIVAQEKERIAALHKHIALQELEIKSARSRQEVLIPKRDFAASVKEGKAFDAEITILQEAQARAEEAVFTAWGELEAAEKNYQVLAEQLQLFIAKADELAHTKQDAITAGRVEIEQIRHERAQFVVHAPAEFINKYESMRQSIANPVVSIAGDMCSGCSTEVMAADIARLKKHALVPCKECYRLLYDRS